MRDTSGHDREFREPDGIRCLERLCAGRRSVWYRADQVRLERTVAVKFLNPFLAESRLFSDAFIEAGRMAASMVHPAALPVINIYPAHHCIAMQWCGGFSLRDRKAPLNPATALFMGEMVMDCLSSLHATGRCHGNLSPGNIFLCDDGRVWVNDFFQPAQMADGKLAFRGDQRFISPEVLAGERADWRSDVFSLGCVMHSGLTGVKCGRELLEILEVMRALDAGRRGESPAAILATLRRIKKLEEQRRGVQPEGAARRKRMYRRVPGEFDVSLRRRSATPEETAVILNKIRDIGESGVFVETDDAFLVVGSIIELDFGLKGIEGNVHAFGVVRWRSSPPMPTGVGVQFLEVDQEGLARLRRFLDGQR